MQGNIKWLIIAAVLFAFTQLTLSGCGGGSKDFSADDFKKATKGMAEDKVKELLGSPIETLEMAGQKHLSFKGAGDKYYNVGFSKDGKAEDLEGPLDKKAYDAGQALLKAAIEELKKKK